MAVLNSSAAITIPIHRIITVHSARVIPKTNPCNDYDHRSNQMKTQVLLFAYTTQDTLPGITETAELFFEIVLS